MTVTIRILLLSSSEHQVDSLHDVILFWVIRDILAWNLEHGRDGLRVAREHVTDLAGNMLVDKDDRNVLSLAKLVERLLDRRNRCVLLDHEEVGCVHGPVTYPSEQEAGDRVLVTNDSDQLSRIVHGPVHKKFLLSPVVCGSRSFTSPV